MQDLKHLIVVKDLPNFDIGKLIISTKNVSISGFELANILRKQYNIEVEMAGINYIIAMTSICDKWDNLERFANALIKIDNLVELKDNKCCAYNFFLPEKAFEVYECADMRGEYVDYANCDGLTILEYIWVYPPGIPLLVPGEKVTKDMIALIHNILESGLEIKSDSGKMPKLFVCKK